jgi:hypothetical protein
MGEYADQQSKAKKAVKPPVEESPSKAPLDVQNPDLLDLQRTVGNQAVQRLLLQRKIGLQTKLTVGPAGDDYEQEADAVAKQVMTMPDPVQRAAPEEEDELQMKRLQRAAQEEDELQMKRLQRVEEEDELQMKRIQRAAPEEEDELQMKRIQRVGEEEEELLQAKSTADSVPEVTDDLEGKIEGSRGSGQPLSESARSFLEPRFGQDFSGVNIHTGAEADSLNRSIEARAFTTGSDIYFRNGEYNPDSSGGRELLAHELTHVVQQGSSQPQRKPDENCEGCD